MKKVAIIGTGIAGMSCAYFLNDSYEITIYEKNDYIGGHTNTIDIFDGEKSVPVDTGFMVFNEETYPYLVKLFNKLSVDYVNTDMGFSVRNDYRDIEYNGSNLQGVFSQRKNMFDLSFLKMLYDINKFNSKAESFVLKKSSEITLGQLVKELDLGQFFFENYLLPMTSAIWSTPVNKMRDYPAKSMIQFLKNHGLLGLSTQLQWKTVSKGSRSYRDILIEKFKNKIMTSANVQRVWENKDKNKVEIEVNGTIHEYDKVIIASHADEALAILQKPTALQKEVLSSFEYQENMATVHTDSSVMPKLKENWSSWNFINKGEDTYTVYYMNKLQDITEKMDVFISINGQEYINKQKVIKEILYHHPVFDTSSIKAQDKIDEMNRCSSVNFVGSYYRYGFHEDALLSSVNLCEVLLGKKVL